MDASRTGLFLSTALPLHPGQQVRLRCLGPCFSAWAEVRYMRRQGRSPGAGLHIVYTMEGREAYLSWLAEQAQAGEAGALYDSGLAGATQSVILSGEPTK